MQVLAFANADRELQHSADAANSGSDSAGAMAAKGSFFVCFLAVHVFPNQP